MAKHDLILAAALAVSSPHIVKLHLRQHGITQKRAVIAIFGKAIEIAGNSKYAKNPVIFS